MRSVKASIEINIPSRDVLDIFLRQEHLKAWWNVSCSLIELKKGGLYSLAWKNNECLEYVSTGIIAEYLPGCQLKIEKLIYMNPQRKILGPMELLVLTTPEKNTATELTVIQSGYQYGDDWNWLYEAVQKAWPVVLKKIKSYLEDEHVLT